MLCWIGITTGISEETEIFKNELYLAWIIMNNNRNEWCCNCKK